MLVRTTLLLLGLLAACSGPPLATGVVEDPPDPFLVEDAPFTLGERDVVRVVVFGHPELSTPQSGQRIDPDGRLSLPLIDPIPLAGLDLDQGRAEIETRLRTYLNDPRVSLSVLNYASRTFFVYGEVAEPGEYALDRPLTALRALAQAGTPTPDADLEVVAVLRGGADDLKVYFFSAETPGPDGMFSVQPNDFVFVRRSGAGTFRNQILPVVQSVVPPIAAFAALVIAADSLDN
jgi:polysaccharide export outer membrane protein